MIKVLSGRVSRVMRTRIFLLALIVLSFAVGAAYISNDVEANHPVLCEGNNAVNAAPQAGPTAPATGAGATATTVAPSPAGTAGDYDGDGMVGTAEDLDNATDRVFGTISQALLGLNGGANANGNVIIVTSGRFPESITIPNVAAGQTTVNGVTTIEAAPGVNASIDAVLQGDPSVAPASTNASRQAGSGIVYDVPAATANRSLILRNLTIRNYTIGLDIRNAGRVLVNNCRFDSNVAHNVMVAGSAFLNMDSCTVTSGGMRFNPAAATPAPGNGVTFMGSANGVISRSVISQNTAVGIANMGTGTVTVVANNNGNNGTPTTGRVFSNLGF